MLQLTKSARPTATGPRRLLRDHPSYCHVCTNFEYDVAQCLIGLRNDIFAQAANRFIEVSATASEIYEGAENGCGSCSVLRWCINEATKAWAVWLPEDWKVTMVYCDGNAMRVYLIPEDDSATTVSQSTLTDGSLRVEIFTLSGI